MAKKRPIEEKENYPGQEDEEAEVSDVDVVMDDVPEKGKSDGPIPFLDTFYGLASNSPAERSESAQALLGHCLLGPDANIKDASYAFKRLLNGLCSGRAAARQGYASVFTSFLKIAWESGVMKQIQDDAADGSSSSLSFIRNHLLMTSDANQAESGKFGKKKGSEERDYLFGRLFGTLAVVRSGILVPSKEVDTVELQSVLSGFTTDLIELHNHKKWMREPASFAIISLLSTLYERCDFDETSAQLVDHLVRNIVIPNVFVEPNKNKKIYVGDFNAEQIAIALNIQSNAHLHKKTLPSPLNRAVVTKENMPILAPAFSATSSVAYPRTHVVWDVMWSYLSENVVEDQKGKLSVRKLRENCQLQGGSASSIVEELVETVICDELLGMKEGAGNATHERKALALTLIKVLSGAQYMSTTTGLFVLSAETGLLDSCILSSVIIQKLFIDVICAGRGKRGGDNLLKPLAVHILESIAESSEFPSGDEKELSRRLAIAKSFIRCEPRFDRTSKTNTVANLLCFEQNIQGSSALYKMWKEYFSFLECEIIILVTGTTEEGKGSAQDTKVLNYVGLLFDAYKTLLRLAIEDEGFKTVKKNITRNVLAFFMATAFFDCSKLKKSKKNDLDPYFSAGLKVKAIQKEKGMSEMSYHTRSMFSARFFSLLSDTVSVATTKQGSGEKEEEESNEAQGKKKNARMLELLLEVCQGWTTLEGKGAVRLTNGNEVDIAEVQKFVLLIQNDASNFSCGSDEKSRATHGCVTGCAILASTLYLHFLHCGTPIKTDLGQDDDDEEEEEEEAEVKEMISDLAGASQGLLDHIKGITKDSEGDEIENPLDDLAQVCAGVLVSPIGAGNEARGASSSLIREAVKFAWVGGLGAAAIDSPVAKSLLSQQVMETLLSSIGIDETGDVSEDNDMEETSEVEESDNDDDQIFAKAAAEGMDVDFPDEVDEVGGGDTMKEANEDVEIGNERLQDLLMREIDESDGEEIEHHEGADGALARLIKLRQEARKAGQQAREKLETSAELRCIFLLETLLTNPSRRWNDQAIKEMIVSMTLPLVRSIRVLDKAIKSAEEGKLSRKVPVGLTEKKVMLQKQMTLLTTKLCKCRLRSSPPVGDEKVTQLVADLLEEARKADSSEQSSCCCAAIIANTRLFGSDDLEIAKSLFSDSVTEWSTKRTSRLSVNLMDGLIQQQPLIAEIMLSVPLCKASTNARSPFLKGESFRLLSLLFGHISIPEAEPNASRLVADNLLPKVVTLFSKAVVVTLVDSQMTTTKRFKDVSKAVDKFVTALSKSTVSLGADAVTMLIKLKDAVEIFSVQEEKKGMSNSCEKITLTLENLIQMQQKLAAEASSKDTRTSALPKKKKKKRQKE